MSLAIALALGVCGYYRPSDVANAKAWWRADLGLVNGVTQTWTDQIGGYVVSQATGGLQLTFSANGGPKSTAKLTGNQASGTILTNTSAALVASGDTRSVIAVVQCQGAPTLPGGAPVSFRQNSVSADFLYLKSGATLFTFSDSTNNTSITNAQDVADPLVIRWDYTVGSNVATMVNGVAQTINTATVAPSDVGGVGFAIGGRQDTSGQSFNGDIMELLITDGALISASDWTNLKPYFLARYGITVS